MKLSTFKLRAMRALVCSWRGHKFERDSAHGEPAKLYFCDRCGIYHPSICIPELDPANRWNPKATIQMPLDFNANRYGSFSVDTEKKLK